jgi:hypothetical protein
LEKLTSNVLGKNSSSSRNESIKAASLNLLKKNALKALFAVPTRVVQKLINKKEKHPIASQPSINVGKLPEANSKTILNKKKYNKITKFSSLGSLRM